MPAQILDGKALAAALQTRLQPEFNQLALRLGRPVGLAVVMVGDHPASQIYVRNKQRASQALGINSLIHQLGADTPEKELLDFIQTLNQDPAIQGILVQLPLPPHIRVDKVVAAIDPLKDVDGSHPLNLGKLFAGQPGLVPCTPAGIMELIRATGQEILGQRAVVVGRSNSVGKPVSLLLLQAHATVTICHSRTQHLDEECRAADILVVAIGRRHSIAGDWIKPGAIVIDVGINREESGLYGDVEFESARQRAGYITPVPGGVGPMTIAMLMANTLQAACLQEEQTR